MKTRIMSFNIWGDYFKNPVEVREDGIGAVIDNYAPDILAVQEITKNWHNSALFARLKEKYAFVKPSNEPANNFIPLLYDKSRFKEIENGFIYFLDTPDNSKGVTWAVLEDSDGSRIAVFGTHFWWQKFGDPAQDAIRASNAALLTAKALEICKKYDIPAVALGDMNSTGGGPNGDPVPSLVYLKASGWLFARDEAPETMTISTHHGDPVKGEDGLYHGAMTPNDCTGSLDHIVYRGALKPTLFKVVTDQYALDASDHSPIFVDFE